MCLIFASIVLLFESSSVQAHHHRGLPPGGPRGPRAPRPQMGMGYPSGGGMGPGSMMGGRNGGYMPGGIGSGMGSSVGSGIDFGLKTSSSGSYSAGNGFSGMPGAGGMGYGK
ncbi:uncharacterized protein LOC135836198 [Planococcus citri]|uniref:uncharacterized protein LOC135836198 n=1 Tax=Planococcus citri TaxID=170843 RepID=UPI0031F84235